MLETNNGTWCTCGDAPSGRVWGEGAGGWADSSLGLRVDDWSSWWVTCPPWQRGLGIALENIVKCPGIFQGDKISRMCSLDSASTSPGTWRPWQCDHLSQWPGAEHQGPGVPAGLDLMWRGSLFMSTALLTTQCSASVALTARLPLQIVLAP